MTGRDTPEITQRAIVRELARRADEAEADCERLRDDIAVLARAFAIEHEHCIQWRVRAREAESALAEANERC